MNGGAGRIGLRGGRRGQGHTEEAEAEEAEEEAEAEEAEEEAEAEEAAEEAEAEEARKKRGRSVGLGDRAGS